MPIATQTAVAVIATQTAVAVQATQTEAVVIATQTAVVVETQTAIVQATQTAVVAATQTAVATNPITQSIWQNGTTGCWAGNCGTGGISIQDAEHWSTFATVSNAMEWTVTVGGFNFFEPTFSLQNSQNQSAFANGHLQFDVELGQAVSNYSAITIFAMGGSNVNLNLATLSNTSFTTVTIPLSTLGTNGTGLMSTDIQFNATQSVGAVLIYFNNVEWTSN
jgi:hypothetical protein